MERKLKGFTIIELMVVLTIIAVLCSIGVPAALTWVRDARLRDANEEARMVYSAVQDYLTELEIKNINLSTSQDHITSASDGGVTLTSLPSEANKSTWGKVFWSGQDAYNFGDDLGDQFEGVWVVKFNKDTYTVEYAWWTAEPDVGGFTFGGVPTAYANRGEQESAFASSGRAIGQFPID